MIILTKNQKTVLAALPCAAIDAAHTINLSSKTISKIMEALEKRGLAHLSAWRVPKNGGKYSAIYAAGPGERALHPLGERRAAHIIEAEKGRHFHILGDDTKFTVYEDRSPARRDPLVTALFGPVRQAA